MRDIGLLTAPNCLARNFTYASLDRNFFFALPSAQRVQLRFRRRPQQRDSRLKIFSCDLQILHEEKERENHANSLAKGWCCCESEQERKHYPLLVVCNLFPLRSARRLSSIPAPSTVRGRRPIRSVALARAGILQTTSLPSFSIVIPRHMYLQ